MSVGQQLQVGLDSESRYFKGWIFFQIFGRPTRDHLRFGQIFFNDLYTTYMYNTCLYKYGPAVISPLVYTSVVQLYKY